MNDAPSISSPAPPALVLWLLPADPRARLSRALAATLWLSFAYFGSIPSWNPSSRFDLVRALVDEQTVAIDTYHANTGDKSYRDGHYFSDKAPGLALLAAPVHLAHRWLAPRASPLAGLYGATVVVVGGLATALALAMLALLGRLGYDATVGLAVTLAASLATPALAYATLFFAHLPAAALLFLAFAIAVLEPADRRGGVAAGLCLGAAFVCEYTTAIGIAAVLAYGVWRLRRGPQLAWLGHLGWVAAGSLGPLLAAGVYNALAFGAPWRIGYATLAPSPFATGMSHGLFGVTTPSLEAWWGITFGGMRGLFHLFPITLAAAVGLARAAWRSSWQLEARVCAVVVFGFFWLNGSYAFWQGGASLGPRHVVPMLPFLMLGLAALPRRPAWLAVWIAAGALSALNAVAGTAVGADLPEYGHAMLDHVWVWVSENRVPNEKGAYNLGTVWGLRGLASLAPLVLFWLASLPLLFELSRAASQGDHHA